MTVGLKKENVAGIITEAGGKTSRSAILARALELPAVPSVSKALELIEDADGKVYHLYANIGSAEAEAAAQSGAEGIGLFRTEFLFMNRTSLPDETVQYEAYHAVSKTMAGKEVIIRTLDVGGGKAIEYLGMDKEDMAAEHGIKLVYVNPNECQDQMAALMELTGGKGYDDIFVYAPIRPLTEMADKLLGFDGCMNFFAGPTANLPKIPGGKKLTYTQFDLPLTAIEDFREKGKTDPLFAKLADSCDAHNGLWNAEAEKILFEHFGVK